MSVRPDPGTVEELRTFLTERHRELVNELDVEELSGSARVFLATVFGKLGNHAASHVRQEVTAGQFTAPSKHRWWTLITLARPFQDHPQFPDAVRPFLTRKAWQ